MARFQPDAACFWAASASLPMVYGILPQRPQGSGLHVVSGLAKVNLVARDGGTVLSGEDVKRLHPDALWGNLSK